MTLPETLSTSPLLIVTETLQRASVTQHPGKALFPSETPESTLSSPTIKPDDFTIQFHPDGQLYVGDFVSMEVIPAPYLDLEDHSIRVNVEGLSSGEPSQAYFTHYGIEGRSQATFQWFWETSALEAGTYEVHLSLQPSNVEWSRTVILSSPDEIPYPEPEATWNTAYNDCCVVHYITGTAAERDLPILLKMVDEQARLASQRLGTRLRNKIHVTFIPRVWGHGGFASQEVSLSYLDRNYAGGSRETILHHELIHILDNQIGGDFRPLMLIEGVAVYQTGGHFKPEPLMPRAAALMPPQQGCVTIEAYHEISNLDEDIAVCSLDWYISLEELMEDFYSKQHEIGYLIAGALVEFMVDRWGWEAFSQFYRDFDWERRQSPSEYDGTERDMDIDAVLDRYFGITLEQLEADFVSALKAEQLSPYLINDVRLIVAYYDTVRRYQKLLDPSAYFTTAWTPGNEQMRQEGIVADFLRRPEQMENLVLELMLVSTDRYLQNGADKNAEETLRAVNRVLDAVELELENPLGAHPLANSYAKLVKAVRSAGYQPQQVEISAEKARVWANITGSDLIELDFALTVDAEWHLQTIVE